MNFAKSVTLLGAQLKAGETCLIILILIILKFQVSQVDSALPTQKK